MPKGRVFRLMPALGALVVLLASAGQSQAQQMSTSDPILGAYQWRQVGPANMSGRVSDLEVPAGGETSTFLVAAADGGIWKTVNNGTTWEHIFEGGKTAAVGDIGVSPTDPNVYYAGMGEPHSRNSVMWGDGVYKTTDGGQTWQHVGLENTGAIGRIVVDPRDANVVYVAALGNLWDLKTDRGLYKSTNGGRSWTLLKGFNDGAGFYDVQLDPTNPDIVWATSWKRQRWPWKFESGGGDNNAIWKSTDAGRTFTKVEGNGLPPTKDNGKIDLEIYLRDPDIIFARVESFTQDPDWEAPPENPDQPNQFRRRGGPPTLSGTYRTTDGGRTWEHVDGRNSRAFYFGQLRVDPNDPNTVYLPETSLYKMDVEGAKAALAAPPQQGGGNFGGGGGNFGGQGQRPRGPVYDIGGNHHVDYHAMWIDPNDSRHMIVGSDGGVSVTWDQGESWDFCDNLVLGQFYAVAHDMAQPYNVYGGLQDNGTWGGPSHSLRGRAIQNRDWQFYVGGDGFHVQMDPEDPDLIFYGESQGGNTTRINLTTGESQSIRPRPPQPVNPNMTPEQRQFLQAQSRGRGNVLNAPEDGMDVRFNWSTPILISPHNAKTVYIGANYLFRSTDRGDTWMALGGDLTTNDPAKYDARNKGDSSTGAENHCTIITIAESPILPGLLWVGTDDGNVQMSRDGGTTWTNVVKNIKGVPANTWVSRVRASAHAEGRAYVTFDGHRTGDNAIYVFATEDYGKTWKKITGGLPADIPAYVITEDPQNPDLLYLGTEHGVYASIDRGTSWKEFSNNMGVMAIHDLVVHPRDHDLIVATHAQSLWICDDVSALQGLTQEAQKTDFSLFDSIPYVNYNGSYEQKNEGDKVFLGQNPPDGIRINYFVGKAMDAPKMKITAVDGSIVREMDLSGEEGLHFVDVPLRGGFGGRGGRGGGGFGGGGPQPQNNGPISEGQSLVTVTAGGQTYTTMITVLPDPRMGGK